MIEKLMKWIKKNLGDEVYRNDRNNRLVLYEFDDLESHLKGKLYEVRFQQPFSNYANWGDANQIDAIKDAAMLLGVDKPLMTRAFGSMDGTRKGGGITNEPLTVLTNLDIVLTNGFINREASDLLFMDSYPYGN